ncbi:MAG: hypothetical protein A2156_01425 [Deltaproteobacteria bacterium RBG_16_48_10]|nr:MAG: hypothetical protein A2156_01425 [Deltaproteobacteria bacterium RBG_16_48_10]
MKQKISVFDFKLFLVSCMVTFFLGVIVGIPVPADSADTIKIGAVAPYTGSNAYTGTMLLNGYKLAVEEINKAGGVIGRQLDLHYEDGKCIPIEGVNAARKLITVDKVPVILGESCSSVTLALMPVCKEEGVPLVNASSSNPKITEQSGIGGNEWVFRTCPDDSSYAKVMGKFMLDQRVKTVCIYGTDDDFGRGASKEVKDVFEGGGGKVFSVNFFSRGQPDHSMALTKMKGENPEALFFVCTMDDGVTIIKQLRELGIKQTIYSRGPLLSESVFKLLGKLIEGVYGTDAYFYTLDNPANIKFREAFKKKFGEYPTYVGFTGYESVFVVKQAIEMTGKWDPVSIRDSLKKVIYKSITGGQIRFDDHNQAHNKIYIARAQGGQVVIVGSYDAR